MDNAQLEHLLMDVGAGQRDAFRALFEATAPSVAARIAHQGATQFDAEAALIDTYAQIWQGDYSVAMSYGQTVNDWLAVLAMERVRHPSGGPEIPIETSEALWRKVAQQAYPEGWRNLLRRTDIVFGIVGAAVWGLILLAFSG